MGQCYAEMEREILCQLYDRFEGDRRKLEYTLAMSNTTPVAEAEGAL